MAEHPESLKNVESLKITDEIKSFTQEIATEVEEQKSQRGTWEQRVDQHFRLRYNIRGKKTFPWPGAANFDFPLIDSAIEEEKADYINLLNVSPVVNYEPYGAEDIDPARKRERLMDWRLKSRVDLFRPYCIGVDTMLGDAGFTVFKIQWKFETRKFTDFLDIEELDDEVVEALYDPRVDDDMLFNIVAEELKPDLSFEENIEEIRKAVKKFREGETKLEFRFIEKEHDQAELIACHPKDDLVVPVDTMDLNDARFIDYKFWRTKNQIKISMRDKKFHKYSDDEIESWVAGNTQQSSWNTNLRDGTSHTSNSESILLHETCVWYDVDGDGIEERCIVTWPDNNPSQVLRFIELPYDHGKWPYVQVSREMISYWFYSPRGLASLLQDYQKGISTKFNQDIDNQTIVNTPQVVYRRGSGFNARNLKYIPGQPIEVNDQSDYEVRQNVNASQGTFLTSAQYLKSWADRRISTVTSAFSNGSNLPGLGNEGKKTAKEISAIEALASRSDSLKLQIFQYHMAKVYEQIDALYDQFGAEEEEILITGENPEVISRREIQGKFNIIPNGRVDNANPALRAAIADAMLRRFLGDPDFKQSELKKMYVDAVDPKFSRRLMLSDEEKAQMNAQLQQQAQMKKIEAVDDQITMERLSNSLDVEHEQALAFVHGKKFAPN